jgi:hypothetical protein
VALYASVEAHQHFGWRFTSQLRVQSVRWRNNVCYCMIMTYTRRWASRSMVTLKSHNRLNTLNKPCGEILNWLYVNPVSIKLIFAEGLLWNLSGLKVGLLAAVIFGGAMKCSWRTCSRSIDKPAHSIRALSRFTGKFLWTKCTFDTIFSGSEPLDGDS